MTLGPSKVLIVNDSRVQLLRLEHTLASGGLTVASTQDPRDVVPLARSFQPDLILLDLHMPVMDGFQVLDRLRTVIRQTDFLPIMVLTADASVASKERALAAGANDFLSEPFDLSELMLRARNLIRTRSIHLSLHQHIEALERQLQRATRRRYEQTERSGARAARIRAVLQGESLHMHYQPIVDLRTGHLLGVEALARFDAKPARSPQRWFSEAAQVGLGVELEVAAVRTAMRGLSQLPPSCYLSVNMSAEAVTAPAGQAVLVELPADRAVLELTGHAQPTDRGALHDAIASVRASGIRLALDDAGEGFTRLRNILSLQPDIIKIGLPLTRGIDVDAAQRALAAALVRCAQDIGAAVVAEGVETEGELAVLHELGVDAGQGYLLGRPQPLPLKERLWTMSPSLPGPPRRPPAVPAQPPANDGRTSPGRAAACSAAAADR